MMLHGERLAADLRAGGGSKINEYQTHGYNVFFQENGSIDVFKS